MHYVLLDVMGIQRTIFETNRLKIILGTSLQLAQWQRQCLTLGKSARWISSAGGNVFACFDRKDEATGFIEKACAEAREMGFAIAWALHSANDDTNCRGIWNELQKEIARFKAGDRDQADYKHLPERGSGAGQNCVYCGVRPAAKGRFIENKRSCSFCYAREQAAGALGSAKGTLLAKLYEDFTFADDLEDIVGGKTNEDKEPLAVAVIDLNDMGARVKEIIPNGFNEFCDFSKGLEETLFRVYSCALTKLKLPTGKCPCRPVLIAGDDAVFALPASKWPSFVLDVFEGLEQTDLSGGAGVIIAAHNYPFSRLVDMAEGLASSAKGLYRHRRKGTPNSNESVVDWHVFQESAFTSPMEARRRGFVHETLGGPVDVATRKPYTYGEFKTLVEKAPKFWGSNLASRKLHTLYEALRYGPEATRDTLVYDFLRDENKEISKYSVWKAVEDWDSAHKGDKVLWDCQEISASPDYKQCTVRDTQYTDSIELFWLQESRSGQAASGEEASQDDK